MWESLFKALLGETQKEANAKQVAFHLSRVALYELTGPDALYPDVKRSMERLTEVMKSQGMPIWIAETFRSAKKQDDYFAKGRSKAGGIITNAEGLESYHQYGLAFDVAFVKYNWNPPSFEWWRELGKQGQKLGLVWGGDFKDWGHFEYHPGFTWQELKKYFERSQL
jgi:peptidoglycan L-alanyl-D-glutamate endopeptidase CwlK